MTLTEKKIVAFLLILIVSLGITLLRVRERYQLAFRLKQKAVSQILDMSDKVTASNLSEKEKTRVLRELLDALATINRGTRI